MSANQTAVGAASAVSAAVGAGSAAVGGSTAAVTSTSTAAAADSSAAGGSGSGSSFSTALTVHFLVVRVTQPPWASGVLRDDGGYSFDVLEETIRVDILALLGGAPEYCCF